MPGAARERGGALLALLLSLSLAGAWPAAALATPQPGGKRGVLLWQLQLGPDQCAGGQEPCFNVYAVNQSTGELIWYAYSTATSGIRGVTVGHHSVYYRTWSGPGLYAVNAATGRVRWQFPLDDWLRYWRKAIDLPPSASFGHAEEARDAVYVASEGPPLHVYGLRTKSGARQWEFKATDPAARLAGAAGPAAVGGGRGGPRALFLALDVPGDDAGGGSRSSGGVSSSSSGSGSGSSGGGGGDGPSRSWLEAVDADSGSGLWRSPALEGEQLSALGLDCGGTRLLAATASASSLLAYGASDGQLLWRRDGAFCPAPSPAAGCRDDAVLLAGGCGGLQRLALLDVRSGRALWEGWDAPEGAAPTGNCTWVAASGGSLLFGCSCSIAPAAGAGAAAAAAPAAAGGRRPPRPAPAAAAGACLYSLSERSGRLRWATALPADAAGASFPPDAQAWGLSPLLLRSGLAVFAAQRRVLAVDAATGRRAWELSLDPDDELAAWQPPALDAASGTLLLAAQRRQQGGGGGKGAKTALYGVGALDGALRWRKALNGTAQPPPGPPGAAEPRRLLLDGAGRVVVEACRGRTCCLRALNASSGKQAWGVCLQAERGEDATHPRAQFAIWLISLATVAAIALLIVSACALYVVRWREERNILLGGGGDASPRHTWRPLPDRPDGSDSDDEHAGAGAGLAAAAAAMGGGGGGGGGGGAGQAYGRGPGYGAPAPRRLPLGGPPRRVGPASASAERTPA